MPASRSRKFQVGLAVSFIALANLPDWPIPYWGHDRYDISHSIFVNVALIGLVLFVLRLTPSSKHHTTLLCVLLGAGAWLSHLLLDSFYNHDRGVAIYWPFSNGRLNFSMPWFNTLDLSQSVVSRHNLSIYGIELAAYLPILIIGLAIGKMIRRQPGISEIENAG